MDKFLFTSKKQQKYLRGLKDPSLARAVYYASLRTDYTHPDSGDWYDRDEDRLRKCVKEYEGLKDPEDF